MYTSALRVIKEGILFPLSVNGRDFIVLIFDVTSSPIDPSPRVEAEEYSPFL